MPLCFALWLIRNFRLPLPTKNSLRIEPVEFERALPCGSRKLRAFKINGYRKAVTLRCAYTTLKVPEGGGK
jgi:hypothetical protein